MEKLKELPIFTQWIAFLEWLLPVTEGFPKRVRFTFSDRINHLALDLVEDLIEARYSSEKRKILRRANLRLEKFFVVSGMERSGFPETIINAMNTR